MSVNKFQAALTVARDFIGDGEVYRNLKEAVMGYTKQPRYVAAYENEWATRESYPTNKIGDTVRGICKQHGLSVECDIPHLNSAEPRQPGPTGPCFYDIECTVKGHPEEFAGIMFVIDLGISK